MPGLSSSLNIGLTGLQAAQNELTVIGHNIANVNTPGFSRQKGVLQTSIAQQFGTLQFGTGVSFSNIMGIRDRFLDLQITQSLSREAGSNARYQGLEGVSSFFMEEGEAGLNLQIQKVFQGFQELSVRPENTAVRTNLLGQTTAMINGMKSRYQMLQDARSKADRAIISTVEEVNTLTDQIAELNKRVATEMKLGTENDARDQRKNLLDQLAAKIGIHVHEDSQGQVQVSLDSGAAVLVSGGTAYDVTTTPDGANFNFARVQVTLSGGTSIDVTSLISEGEIGAQLDMRDRLIAGYQRKMDELAAGVVFQVNALHRAGFGLNGATGNDFFVAPVGNQANGLPLTVSAATNYQGMVNALGINNAIVANPSLIAAADVAGVPGNNIQAKAIARLYESTVTVDSNGDGAADTGSFSSMVANLVNRIGTDVQQYKTASTNQENLVTALQTQRDRVSAVDLDEEATNLIIFQRGYQACSRFINVINQLTDQLVNQFGQ